jgi:repressor LexA
MTTGTTRKQQQILAFIAAYIKQHQYSPSYREIQQHFNFASLGSVSKHLGTLKRRGLLTSAKHCSRSIQVSPQDAIVSLPFLGTIRAGRPIEAVSEADQIAIPACLVPENREHFVLKVTGDSMRDAQVSPGDLIVVERRSTADTGQIVVALINNHEATLKRYFPRGSRVVLEAAHPDYAPIDVPAESVTIQGVLVSLLRRYR